MDPSIVHVWQGALAPCVVIVVIVVRRVARRIRRVAWVVELEE